MGIIGWTTMDRKGLGDNTNVPGLAPLSTFELMELHSSLTTEAPALERPFRAT